MTIISQEKDATINFDNITTVRLRNNEDNKSILIGIDDVSGCSYIIAKYETEERAKEVINDIAPTKAMFEYFKCMNSVTQELMAEGMRDNDIMFDTYEMPKE